MLLHSHNREVKLHARDFIIEIGTEEIPAGYLKDAVKYIEASFSEFLKKERLAANDIRTAFTPRRLTLLAFGLPEKQEDLDVVRIGPFRKIAFTETGSVSKALEGFLKINNAILEDVFWQDTSKGEMAAIRIYHAGKTTPELLSDWINALLKAIPFPKKMKWGSSNLEFARPVRWLVCLFGDEILQVKSNHVVAGKTSMGNRFAGLETSVRITSAEEYCSQLKTVQVIADRQERYGLIKQQLLNIFPKKDYFVDLDEGLLQTVTDLVEFPTAVLAEFEDRFLVLPEKIVNYTISQNQKYFAVRDLNGKLTNQFIFISNGNPDFNDVIRKGNEKVVKPRLEDAMWYYREDTKHKLEEFVALLSEVVFQAELGTLKDKTERIIENVKYIARQLNLSENDAAKVTRTAMLCKADLVTKMLGEKEFTKLQGYIGMHYALASGEPEEVATGIYEHYMPKGPNDELPQTLCGSIVAVADKLDTVCGIIGIGMLPTGSADPYALRRAANGIVQIVAENKWNVDITEFIRYALDRFKRAEISSPANVEIVLNYFHQRINWHLQQQSIDYDVIESVMHIDYGNLLHLMERARALQDFKKNEDFVKLVIGFKRVSNIIKDETQKLTIEAKLFTVDAERTLFSALNKLEKDILAELKHLNYTGVLDKLVNIRTDIDKFFDDVLVNTEDEHLRRNRYALLQEIRSSFLQVADLSLLVVEGK